MLIIGLLISVRILSGLTAAITTGKGKMPPYKTLSAEQVKDLVAYIRAFGKKK